MIDFHTHILPEIDDGSNSVKESVVLIKQLKQQGVNNIVLTPHFYAYSSSAENFNEIKSKSLKTLLEELKTENIEVSLYSGCEVFFFEELWRIDNLKDLCIKGTEYMLLEMPFTKWTGSMVRSIERLIGKGITPIIAHFERYIKHKENLAKIYELVEMGVILQMNCAYINKFSTRRKAISFIRKGMVSLLGSDCHNVIDRAPEYSKAIEYIKKKLSKEDYRRFIGFQKKILSGAQRVYPL